LEQYYAKKPWLHTYPEWLPKTLPLPRESVLDRFENSALKYPDEPCIYYFDTMLRYKDVRDMAGALAASLEKIGVNKGDRVLLWMQNIPQVAIATLAAWMRGAAVVPANPMYTVKDIQYLIRDCSPKVVFCQDEIYHPDIADDNLPVILTSPLDLLNPNREIPEQLKEVHKNIPRQTLDFMSLIHTPGNAQDVPIKPEPLIPRYGATFTVASITVYIALLNHPESGNFNLSSLIKAYSGGAPVSPGTVEKIKNVLGLTIYNVYGLTESTSPATITPVGLTGPVDMESGALSVGLIIPGVEAWIVDVDDPEKILPPGQAGELAIQGPSITGGYWAKPEETAHAIKNGRFFTGDVAKIDENGWCFIVDRKKDQINVSGYKVWPRDVEDVLYQHHGVKEAAVVGIQDPYRGETVKAFVALTDACKGKVTPEELIAFCKGRMAAFKYPRIVEIIDEVPKTPTGKFLRRVLKKEP